MASLHRGCWDSIWAAATYSDYALFGSLQRPRCVSGTEFLLRDSVARHWFERMVDLHDAYARNALTVRDLVAAKFTSL
jgi:hypothetical protein